MGERTGDLHETAFLHLEEQHFVGAVMPVRTEADDRTTEDVAVALYALQRLEKAVGGQVLAGLLEHLDQHVGNALAVDGADIRVTAELRSEEHTSELQSLMRISYSVFCLQKKKKTQQKQQQQIIVSKRQ